MVLGRGGGWLVFFFFFLRGGGGIFLSAFEGFPVFESTATKTDPTAAFPIGLFQNEGDSCVLRARNSRRRRRGSREHILIYKKATLVWKEGASGTGV